MKIKELRIGNILRYLEVPVMVLSLKCISLLDDKYDVIEMGYFKDSVGFERVSHHPAIEGVPLTLDILAACGFELIEVIVHEIRLPGNQKEEYDGYECYRNKEYASVLTKDGIFKYEIDYHTDDVSDTYFAKEIKYLHQLQNLYYQLEDKELEVNI